MWWPGRHQTDGQRRTEAVVRFHALRRFFGPRFGTGQETANAWPRRADLGSAVEVDGFYNWPLVSALDYRPGRSDPLRDSMSGEPAADCEQVASSLCRPTFTRGQCGTVLALAHDGDNGQEWHAMPVFEAAFGVPAGHTLRKVRLSSRPHGRRRSGWEWEHEEYDAQGVLVAVYESWTRDSTPPDTDHASSIVGFVKYSPHGWVLRRADLPSVQRTAITVRYRDGKWH
jgi:hypothetical protein